MATTALIVAPYWGTPLEGGAPAATRHLIRQLKVLEMDVVCLIPKTTELAKHEEKELGVTLLSPPPSDYTPAKGPNRDILHYLVVYSPQLKQLENVTLVVGFGLLSSSAAHKIKLEYFSEAKLIVINTWPLGSEEFCDAYEFERIHYENVMELLLETESPEADVVFSLFNTTYNDLYRRYQGCKGKVNHKEYIFTPDKKYYAPPIVVPNEDDRLRCILSAVPIEDQACNAQHYLAKILHSLPESLHQFPPPKWVIFDMSDEKKEEFRPEFEVNYNAYVYNCLGTLDSQLCCGDLAISSGHSQMMFAFTTMARGIPTLVPRHSDSHKFVQKHLDAHKDEIVVDMKNEEQLNSKMTAILHRENKDREIWKTRTSELRNKFQAKCEELDIKFLGTLRETLNSNLTHGHLDDSAHGED